MESWSWPPRYDAEYRPPNDQVHWFPVRETMDPEQRDEAILERIQQLMAYAWEKAPFYRKKWSEAGLEPGDITSLEAFESVPVIKKEELRLDQAANEPYGSYLCIDRAAWACARCSSPVSPARACPRSGSASSMRATSRCTTRAAWARSPRGCHSAPRPTSPACSPGWTCSTPRCATRPR